MRFRPGQQIKLWFAEGNRPASPVESLRLTARAGDGGRPLPSVVWLIPGFWVGAGNRRFGGSESLLQQKPREKVGRFAPNQLRTRLSSQSTSPPLCWHACCQGTSTPTDTKLQQPCQRTWPSQSRRNRRPRMSTISRPQDHLTMAMGTMSSTTPNTNVE